jgi:hypothetical protein
MKQQIARYFKMPTWSANQLQGAKHDREHVRIPDMGFAKNIADNVDVGIGIGLTDMSEEEGVFNIDFTKTRDFSAKGFQVKADRALMTFRSQEGRKEDKIKFRQNIVGGKIRT